jgi:hypothetical protein
MWLHNMYETKQTFKEKMISAVTTLQLPACRFSKYVLHNITM